MSIRAILIDDEELARIGMDYLIKKHTPHVEVVGEAESAEEGVALIKKLKPDLVFLDIEMAEYDGFDMLDKIDGIDFEVVFVTAHNQFALRAFKYEAIDYILKPVDPEDLIAAVEKVDLRLKKRNTDLPASDTVDYLSSQYSKISVPNNEGFKFINITDIIRMEADGSYVTIYTENDRPCVVSRPLGYYANILNKRMFVRIHRSHLINLHKVKEFRKEAGGYVIMDNDEKIQVASTKKKDLMAEFK